jgi:hypothetical protein
MTLLCGQTLAQTSGMVRIGVMNDMAGVYSDDQGPGSVLAAQLAVEDHGSQAAGRKVEVVSAVVGHFGHVARGDFGSWYSCHCDSEKTDGDRPSRIHGGVGSRGQRLHPEPGGNLTGFTNFHEPSMGAKWVELLKEIAPGVSRVGILFNPHLAPGGGMYLTQPVETSAASLGVKTVRLPVQSSADIDQAINAPPRLEFDLSGLGRSGPLLLFRVPRPT